MTGIDALFAGPWGPVIIFFLRISDVSLSTLRMLLLVRNSRVAVPLIGFFEVIIWIFAISHAMQNLHSPWHMLGYAGGFAAGNSVGMWLETRLGYGFAILHVISRDVTKRVADELRALGHRVTGFWGHDAEGEVELLYIDVPRRDVKRVFQEVLRLDPSAFIAVEEPKSLYRGWLFKGRRK